MSIISDNSLIYGNEVKNSSGVENGKSKKSDPEEQLRGFLQVLTEQMRHQDPTSPMESGDFSQLMSSFVMSRESARTNDLLGEMLALQKNSSGNGATGSITDNIGYVGHRVKCSGNVAFASADGANFTFNLSDNSSNVEIIIKDNDSNQEVFRENIGFVEAGRNKYLWRGEGKIVPGKEYGIEVIAKDGNAEVGYDVDDIVSSISKSEKGAVYAILSDGMPINVEQIKEVSKVSL